VGALQQSWQYLEVNLCDLKRREREVDILNVAGAEGWELITIAVSGVALLKRQVVEDSPAPPSRRRGAARASS